LGTRRMSQFLFLARLLGPKRPAAEFTFGLEPIVKLTPVLYAAFKIDFVSAKSDFLDSRRVPCVNLRRRRLGGGCFGLHASISLWFRWHTLSPVMPQAVRLEQLHYL
jgi:hypothetical protein